MELIRKVFRAALELKEQYERGASPDKISGYSQNFLSLYEILKSSLPPTVFNLTGLENATYWIDRKRYDAYNDIRGVCDTFMFRLEDNYIKLMLAENEHLISKIYS